MVGRDVDECGIVACTGSSKRSYRLVIYLVGLRLVTLGSIYGRVGCAVDDGINLISQHKRLDRLDRCYIEFVDVGKDVTMAALGTRQAQGRTQLPVSTRYQNRHTNRVFRCNQRALRTRPAQGFLNLYPIG